MNPFRSLSTGLDTLFQRHSSLPASTQPEQKALGLSRAFEKIEQDLNEVQPSNPIFGKNVFHFFFPNLK
jgi:hypothetical protein